MDIRDYSSQFTIYVYSKDIDKGTSIKVQLSQGGYDAYYFQEVSVYTQRLRQNPPHMVVFDTLSLPGGLSDFVEQSLKINHEIKFILISPANKFDILRQYARFGLEAVVIDEKEYLQQRVLWAADRSCEKLYYQYQNEQLIASLQVAQKSIDEKDQNIVQTQSLSQFNMSISERLNLYKSAESKEALVQSFCNQVSPIKIIFFKFLDTVSTFVLTYSSGFEVQKMEGMGAQLSIEEMKALNQQMTLGVVPPPIAQVLSKNFGKESFIVLPLYVRDSLEGFFAYSQESAETHQVPLSEEFMFFSVLYTNFWLEKKVGSLEVQDFVTGLYNRTYYYKMLKEEVERAGRSRLPLSVVKLSIDDFFELEQTLGEVNRDALFKSISSFILGTSRSNDICCRTQMNEISLILPDSGRKGAALRAERIRRTIESTQYLENGIKVSLSLGVSEYPSLCDSPDSLDETAYKALHHIQDKGGNKICLYKPPQHFRPLYEVPAE